MPAQSEAQKAASAARLFELSRRFIFEDDLDALGVLQKMLPGRFEGSAPLTLPEMDPELSRGALRGSLSEEARSGFPHVAMTPEGSLLGILSGPRPIQFSALDRALTLAQTKASRATRNFQLSVLNRVARASGMQEEDLALLSHGRAMELGIEIETSPRATRDTERLLRDIERAPIEDAAKGTLRKRLERRLIQEIKQRTEERLGPVVEEMSPFQRRLLSSSQAFTSASLPFASLLIGSPQSVLAGRLVEDAVPKELLGRYLAIPGADRKTIDAHLSELTNHMLAERVAAGDFLEKSIDTFAGALGFLGGPPIKALKAGKALGGKLAARFTERKLAQGVSQLAGETVAITALETARGLTGDLSPEINASIERMLLEGLEEDAEQLSARTVSEMASGAALGMVIAGASGMVVAPAIRSAALQRLAKSGRGGAAAVEGLAGAAVGSGFAFMDPETRDRAMAFLESPSWERLGAVAENIGAESLGFGAASAVLTLYRTGAMRPSELIPLLREEPRTPAEAAAKRQVVHELARSVRIYHPRPEARGPTLSTAEIERMDSDALGEAVRRAGLGEQANEALVSAFNAGAPPEMALRSVLRDALERARDDFTIEGLQGRSEVLAIEQTRDRGAEAILASGERVALTLPGEPVQEGRRALTDRAEFERLFEQTWTLPDPALERALAEQGAGVSSSSPRTQAEPAPAPPTIPVPNAEGGMRSADVVQTEFDPADPAKPFARTVTGDLVPIGTDTASSLQARGLPYVPIGTPPAAREPAAPAPPAAPPPVGAVVELREGGVAQRGKVVRHEGGGPVVRLGPGREIVPTGEVRVVREAVSRPIPAAEVAEPKGGIEAEALRRQIAEGEGVGALATSPDLPRALKFARRFLGEIAPELGRGRDSLWFEGEGDRIVVLRLGRGKAVPDVPEVLKPTVRRRFGEVRIEVFPRVETEGITPSDVRALQEQLAARGLELTDPSPGNVGRRGRQLVVLDPDDVVRARPGARAGGRQPAEPQVRDVEPPGREGAPEPPVSPPQSPIVRQLGSFTGADRVIEGEPKGGFQPVTLRFRPRVPPRTPEVVAEVLERGGFTVTSRAGDRVEAEGPAGRIGVGLEATLERTPPTEEPVTFEAASQRARAAREAGVPDAEILEDLRTLPVDPPSEAMRRLIKRGTRRTDVARMALDAATIGPEAAESRYLREIARDIIRREPGGSDAELLRRFGEELESAGGLIPREILEGLLGRAKTEVANQALSSVRIPQARQFLRELDWNGLTREGAEVRLSELFGELSPEARRDLLDERFTAGGLPRSGDPIFDALVESASARGEVQTIETIERRSREGRLAERTGIHPKALAYAVARAAGLLDVPRIEAERARVANELFAIGETERRARILDQERAAKAGRPTSPRVTIPAEELPEFLRTKAKTFRRVQLASAFTERAQLHGLLSEGVLDDLVRATARSLRGEGPVSSLLPELEAPGFEAQPQKAGGLEAEKAREEIATEAKRGEAVSRELDPAIAAELKEAAERVEPPQGEPGLELLVQNAGVMRGREDVGMWFNSLARDETSSRETALRYWREGLIELEQEGPSVTLTEAGRARVLEGRRADSTGKPTDFGTFEILWSLEAGTVRADAMEGFLQRDVQRRPDALENARELGLVSLEGESWVLTQAGRDAYEATKRARPRWFSKMLSEDTGTLEFHSGPSIPRSMGEVLDLVQDATMSRFRAGLSKALVGIDRAFGARGSRLIARLIRPWGAPGKAIEEADRAYFEEIQKVEPEIRRILAEQASNFTDAELLLASRLLEVKPGTPMHKQLLSSIEASPELRAEVERVREAIFRVSEELHEGGHISDDTFNRLGGAYLSRDYMKLRRKFLGFRFGTRKTPTTPQMRAFLEAANKLKGRKEIGEEGKQALELILDPAYRSAISLRNGAETLGQTKRLTRLVEIPGTSMKIEEWAGDPRLRDRYRAVKPWVVRKLRSSPYNEHQQLRPMIEKLGTHVFTHDVANRIEGIARTESREFDAKLEAGLKMWRRAVTIFNNKHWWNNFIGTGAWLLPMAGVWPWEVPRKFRRGKTVLSAVRGGDRTDGVVAELLDNGHFMTEVMKKASRDPIQERLFSLMRGEHPKLVMGKNRAEQRDGPGAPELEPVAEAISLLDRARMGGKVTNETIRRWYGAMEAWFITTLYAHHRSKGIPPARAYRLALEQSGSPLGAPEWLRSLPPVVNAIFPFLHFPVAMAKQLPRAILHNPGPLLAIMGSVAALNAALRSAQGLTADEDEKKRVLDGRASWRIGPLQFAPDFPIGKNSYLKLSRTVPLDFIWDTLFAVERGHTLERVLGGAGRTFPIGGPLLGAAGIFFNVDPFTGKKLRPEGAPFLEGAAYTAEALLYNVAPVSPTLSRGLDQLLLPKKGFLRETFELAGEELPERFPDPTGERSPGTIERLVEFLAPISPARGTRHLKRPQEITQEFERRERRDVFERFSGPERRRIAPLERRLREELGLEFRRGEGTFNERVRQLEELARRRGGAIGLSSDQIRAIVRDLAFTGGEIELREQIREDVNAAAESFLRRPPALKEDFDRQLTLFLGNRNTYLRLRPELQARLAELAAARR